MQNRSKRIEIADFWTKMGAPVRIKVTDSCEGLVAGQDKNGVKKCLDFRPHNGHT